MKKRYCLNGEIRVILQGGLGNQLFQFATALQLAVEKDLLIKFFAPASGRPLGIDFIGLEPEFSYKPIISNDQLNFKIESGCKECSFDDFFEKQFQFQQIDLRSSHIQLNGYFQSPKYFGEVSNYFKSYLRNRLALNNSTPSNIIHIRTGDYLRKPYKNIYRIISGKEIANAIKISQVYSEWKIITESEDFIRTNHLSFLPSDTTFLRLGNCDILYFAQMVSSSNLIVSNSTFSWWGAFLSNANVFVPKSWFRFFHKRKFPLTDLIPVEWTQY